MSYELRISRRATRYFQHLVPRVQVRVAMRLDEIAVDPYNPNTKLLRNRAGERSARVGDIRIIYTVDELNRVVDVAEIVPRGRAYRD